MVDACAEICQLGILSHTEVLYIAKVDSREPIQIISRVGSRMPARKTALGKALLSQCKREEVVALFAGELCTEPFDMDAFLEELQKVRQGAIARDIGEINPQLHCYAVPVTFAGRVDCAMNGTESVPPPIPTKLDTRPMTPPTPAVPILPGRSRLAGGR